MDDPVGPRPRPSSVSPALLPALTSAAALGPAFEIKFLLTPAQAAEVQARLIKALLPDPHSDPTLGGMYRITSLAFDSPDLSVFFRDPRMRNRKYRVRRYGGADAVYLEMKRSRQRRVRKRRSAAALADLAPLAEGRVEDLTHDWFVRAARATDLAPVCRVRYLRRALFGVCAEGPMRVTFDHDIHGSLAAGWSMDPAGAERPLLQDVIVCEFKFHRAMPAPLKSVVTAMKLSATGISKYRRCVCAFAAELGLDPAQVRACALGSAESPTGNCSAGTGGEVPHA
jgi:hypothetical protein